MEVSGQPYSLAALPLGKEAPEPIEWVGTWASMDVLEKSKFFASTGICSP